MIKFCCKGFPGIACCHATEHKETILFSLNLAILHRCAKDITLLDEPSKSKTALVKCSLRRSDSNDIVKLFALDYLDLFVNGD